MCFAGRPRRDRRKRNSRSGRRKVGRQHASGGATLLPLRVYAAFGGCGSSAGFASVVSFPSAPPALSATATATNAAIPTAGGGCAPHRFRRRLSRAKSIRARSSAMSAPTPRRRGTTAAVSTAASPLSTASFSANCFRGAEVRALKGVNGQVWGAPLAPAARRQRWQRQAHQRRRRRRQPRQHLAWTTPQRRRRRRRQRRQQPSPHNMAARPSTRQTRCQRRRHRYSHRHRHRLCRRRRRGAAEAGPPSLALRKPANRWRQCGRGGRPCAVTVAAAARPRCHRRRRPRHGRQRHCCPRWPLGARPDAGTSHLREPGAAARRTPTTPPLQLPAYLIPPPHALY